LWHGPGAHNAVVERQLITVKAIAVAVGVLWPVVGMTMQTAAARPVFAMLLMLAYGAGHRGVLALAAASGPRLSGYSSWNERGVTTLRRVCGGLVLAGGLYLVYAAP
jgi:cytochrome c-type biogenesis protein